MIFSKKGILSKLRVDGVASLVVFFVALPLCLGIALASGAPLLSGIVAGIIGGIVIGFISNSALSVSGPAAGLVVIVVSAITQLGSFQAFLVAVVLAGVIQVAMGLVRAGAIGNYFPSSVIKGMLASIGLILILKQVPHLLGVDADAFGDDEFYQADGSTTFTYLGYALSHVGIGSALIGLFSLLFLIAWDSQLKNKASRFRRFPASLAVVILGVSLKFALGMFPFFTVSADSLVRLPEVASFGQLQDLFIFPDFTALKNKDVYVVAVTLAIVASLETLLSIEAIDRLDPKKRVTNRDRELVAQGIGNSVSGLLGGLPITAVIVRSSANLTAGARSKRSTILHGTLLLVSVFFFARFLNEIPLSCLAAILIMVGYKLTKPSLFTHQWKLGMIQFAPFVITFVSILLSDLLIGITIGMGSGLFVVLMGNHGLAYFRADHKSHVKGFNKKVVFRLSQHISFLNKANLQKAFDKLPKNVEVLIDGENTQVFDYDALETIYRFQESSRDRGISVTLTGVPPLDGKNNLEFQNELKQLRNETTSDEIFDQLLEGNKRFITGNRIHRNYLAEVKETSMDQFPPTVVLSCIDSRAPIEIIFDQGIGDIFSIRVAGNIVNDDVLASLEFACNVKKSKLLLVLGHTGCGAVAGACANVEGGHLTHLLAKIKPAVEKYDSDPDRYKGLKIDAVARLNVDMVIDSIRQSSSILADLESEGKIKIAGAMYDIQTGKVKVINEKQPVYVMNK